MISFKEWLKLDEVGTSTACVANFKCPVMPMVTRQWPTVAITDDPNKKKKKPRLGNEA